MGVFSAGNSDTVIEADYQLFTCSVDGWFESPKSPKDIEASKGRKLRQGWFDQSAFGREQPLVTLCLRFKAALTGRCHSFSINSLRRSRGRLESIRVNFLQASGVGNVVQRFQEINQFMLNRVSV